jgi:hypothetical protein
MQAQESSRLRAAWKYLWISFPLCGLLWIASIVVRQRHEVGLVFATVVSFYIGFSLPGALVIAPFIKVPVFDYFDNHYPVVLAVSFCIYFLLGYGFIG